MISKILNIKNKKIKSPIICLTAYQKSVAKILDKYCDIILVGDSLANVLYEMKDTHKVSLEMMINHARSVKKGIKNAILVVDMPKNSYKTPSMASKNALKIIKTTKCDAVKVESNNKNFHIIKHLVKSKIKVMGHIGYTPQFKKFKVAGKDNKEKNNLTKEALNIEKAGAFAIVLECINSSTAKIITKSLKIPTIGIGSSLNCDGQILVTDDILGLSGFKPRFVKKYLNLNKLIENAVKEYRNDIINKKFPKKKT